MAGMPSPRSALDLRHSLGTRSLTLFLLSSSLCQEGSLVTAFHKNMFLDQPCSPTYAYLCLCVFAEMMIGPTWTAGPGESE